MPLPPFPADGPLRPLAMGATMALAGYLAAFVSSAVARDRSSALWTAAVLALAGLTILFGMKGSAFHTAASVLTAAVAARNVWKLKKLPRLTTAIGLAGWFVALVSARILFS